MTKQEYRRKIAEAEAKAAELYQKDVETRKRVRALVELLPDNVMTWISYWHTKTIHFYETSQHQGLEGLLWWRKQLREAFGSWEDRASSPWVSKETVTVAYTGEVNDVTVTFNVSWTHEEFEQEVLSDTCKIVFQKPEIDPDDGEYTIVCNQEEE